MNGIITLQLVTELATFSTVLAGMLQTGEVVDMWLAQSDIKDMHACILRLDIVTSRHV
jgi:hypothetical protein